MDFKNFKAPDRRQRNIMLYALIVLGVLLVINLVVMPMIQQAQVKQEAYSFMLEQLEAGNIEKAEVYSDIIVYQVKDASGQTGQIYRTTRMYDEKLVDRLYEAGVTFTPVIEQQGFLDILLGWILPLAIMVLPIVFIMRMMRRQMGGEGSTMSFGKNTAKIYSDDATGKTFADFAGQEEAKESLQELVDFLKNPARYTEIGAKLPKGALLFGPPGTGKTLLAKAVAGEARVPFFSITGSHFVEMFVGVGASRVRDLFKQAVDKAPCIVFIDEIDAIGKSRNGPQMGGNDEREQTLNQLLSEMDGFDSSKGVIIIAATNRPDVLDPALLRPGRFDRRIMVDLPDLQGREAILKVHARAVKAGTDVDYATIAKQTVGVSGADLANIVNEAAINAVRQRRKVVEQRDLLFAVDLVLAGAERKSAVLSAKEKALVAYHEIGHALVGYRTGNAQQLQKVTIIPRTMGSLGFNMNAPEENRYLMLRDEALNQVRSLMGGRAAEEVKFGERSSGASGDITQATNLARAMVTRYGMSEKFDMMGLAAKVNQFLGDEMSMQCSPEMAAEVDAEVLDIIKKCHADAVKILTADVQLLDSLAQTLLQRETLSGEEFNVLIADYEFQNSQPENDQTAL